MRYLIDCVYLLLLLLVSPWLLYAAWRHGKYRHGLAQKLLGSAPRGRGRGPKVWFHAVSVGEVNVLPPLLTRLQSQRPDVDLFVSTTTRTGYELARSKYPHLTVFYCPLDFSWAVRRALRRIGPDLLVLVELELWPNLLTAARQRGVPVAIVNGRLGDRSFRGYRRFRPVVRRWLRSVQAVAAQSQTCSDRFVALGIPSHRVRCVGSIKFDGAAENTSRGRSGELARLAGIPPHDVVFLAGSTQAPEEALAIEVFRSLRDDFPRLRLIIVPRHRERFQEVAQLLRQSDLPWLRRTELAVDSRDEQEARILLVDTIGELGDWWGRADVGFVGGSLGSRGGQNMIEPAAFGVAVSFGPRTRNFRDIVQLLLADNAAVVVRGGEELKEFVGRCLRDADFRRELGLRAREVVQRQQGAAERTTATLLSLLPEPRVDFGQ